MPWSLMAGRRLAFSGSVTVYRISEFNAGQRKTRCPAHARRRRLGCLQVAKTISFGSIFWSAWMPRLKLAARSEQDLIDIDIVVHRDATVPPKASAPTAI